MDCTLSSVSNRTNGFSFSELFTIHGYLYEKCKPGSEIFFLDTGMLTDATCRRITGLSNSLWSGWSSYPVADIWTRIVTWKLPLFQLIAQFPRPPLGFCVELGSILHLLGDPVDSMTSMLVSLATCRKRADEAKKLCSLANIKPSDPEYHPTWKGLAIFMVSYDECGKSDEVDRFCEEYLRLRDHPDFETEIRHIYEETANCLAADRRTVSLPVFIAESFFIGGWLIALAKASSTEPSPTNWPNVEAHSIAFSGMYLWVTSAIVIGSVIGASQTEGSIPRLLQGFEYHLKDFRGHHFLRRPSAIHREEASWAKVGKERAAQGGMYMWRPTKWRGGLQIFGIGTWKVTLFTLTAMAVLGASYFTAIMLSLFVPPRGLSCRHIPETIMLLTWLFSFAVECVLERLPTRQLFWAVFCKDLIFASSNIMMILITQWGILNRCSCWTMWGWRGLHLPQLPDVKPELMYFIRHTAPAITFLAILFQFAFCAVVAWKYLDAVRVYVQRDDGVSNLQWKGQDKLGYREDRQI